MAELQYICIPHFQCTYTERQKIWLSNVCSKKQFCVRSRPNVLPLSNIVEFENKVGNIMCVESQHINEIKQNFEITSWIT